MPDDLRKKLQITAKRFKEINDFLLDPKNEQVSAILKLVKKYGGPEAINHKAAEARKLENLLARLEKENSPYLKDVKWLMARRDAGAFVSMKEYREKILGGAKKKFNEKNAVTLEISSLQFFPFLIAEAKQAIANRELMPGRYIRVRNMKE